MKSQEHKYVALYAALLEDVEALTGLSLRRDLEEISKRVAHEGISFLTRVLPKFYANLLTSVENGVYQPCAGFKTRRKGPLPQFLGGLVDGLFLGDGTLRSDRSSEFLGYIGQICTFLYKCEFPYTEAQLRARLRKFVEVEDELNEFIGPSSSDVESTLSYAILFCQALFKGFSIEGARPRHGPGAVAEREKGYEKYNFSYFPTLDEEFKYDDWLHPIGNEMAAQEFNTPESHVHDLPYIWMHPVLEEGFTPFSLPTARGIFVQKDARGPRYISAEPKELMWVQQALGRRLAQWLESNQLSRGHVNFTKQDVNRDLALSSSVTKQFATLDLEDASDRVSLALVRLLVPSKVTRLLEACRSEFAKLPDGSIVKLKKFAPMGSACCFPVESLVFYALCVATIQQLTGWSSWRASRLVYVYGDDLIIPPAYVNSVKKVFTELHLVINERKTFVNGPFRESCGIDAIDGIIVTPIKLRKPIPKNSKDWSAIVSLTDTSNQLFYAGFWRASEKLRRTVEGAWGRKLQYVPYQSGCLGVTGFSPVYSLDGEARWSDRYQTLEIPVVRIRTKGRSLKEGTCAGAVTLHSLVAEPLREPVTKTSTLFVEPKALGLKVGWKRLS